MADADLDRDRVLLLMDRNMQEMYREMMRCTPGGFVEERAGLVMIGSPRGSVVTNMAMIAAPTDVGTIVTETERVFVAREMPFSIYTRSHLDRALEAALAERGFRELVATPGMIFRPGDGSPVRPPAELEIRPVTDDAGRAAYAEIMGDAYAVYGTPVESSRSFFARLESVIGPTTQAFLGWTAGRAVSGATLYLSHGIGGVGWVGTRPDAFGRGYGAAVAWAVVAEGLRRGAPLLNLQASPMGASVYRRMGFSTPTHYRMFVPVA